MQTHEVEFATIDSGNTQELSDVLYRTCCFCDKIVMGKPQDFTSSLALSKEFHCAFCLQRSFNLIDPKNVLILSYRSLIGYYYHSLYLSNKISFYELNQRIENHVKIGTDHPLFNYDPSNYLWFINFSQVNDDQVPLPEILDICLKILLAFGLTDKISAETHDSVWKKYSKAIALFHTKRERPKNRRMLIPTLKSKAEKDSFWNMTKNFTKSQLIPK